MYLDVVATVAGHPTPRDMHEIKASKRLGRSLLIKDAALMRSEVSPMYDSQSCYSLELLSGLNIKRVSNTYVRFAPEILKGVQYDVT